MRCQLLDGYGLHKLVWDACDERFGDVLVTSSADTCGRGISLVVREGGAAAILAFEGDVGYKIRALLPDDLPMNKRCVDDRVRRVRFPKPDDGGFGDSGRERRHRSRRRFGRARGP